MTAQSLNLISIGPWDFNGFDVVVLIILLISMLYAASRGFMREVISIAALLVAAIATLFVWGQFRFAAQDFISPAWLADGALLVGVFFIVYLIMVLIMSKIGKSIAGKEPGFLDRILGAVFGIARGLIIAALGVPKPLPDMLANSTFYPLLEKIGNGLKALPFAQAKTYAERIKDGDLQGISEDILESGQ